MLPAIRCRGKTFLTLSQIVHQSSERKHVMNVTIFRSALYLLVSLASATASSALAATYVANDADDGNWSAPATWGLTSGYPDNGQFENGVNNPPNTWDAVVDSNAVTLDTAATIEKLTVGGAGAGSLDMNGNTLNLQALEVTNNQTFAAGSSLAVAGLVDIAPFDTNIRTTTFDIPVTMGSLTMRNLQPHIAGTGDLTVNGLFTMRAGRLLVGGVLNANGGADFNLTVANQNFNNRTINIQGASSFTNSGTSRDFTNNGTINLLSGSLTANLPNGNDLFLGNGTVNISAGVLVDISGGATFALNNTSKINNAGTFQVNSGHVSFSGTGTYTQTGGATVVEDGTKITFVANDFQAGTIGGNGELIGAINNTGATVSPGLSTGKLTITGSLTNQSAASMFFEIGGTGQGALLAGYDWLDVSNTLELGGSTLLVDLVGGFTPDSLDTFTLITAGTLNGTFGNISDGQRFDVGGGSFLFSQIGGNIQLSDFQAVQAIPEPGTISLLGLGMLALSYRRRAARTQGL